MLSLAERAKSPADHSPSDDPPTAEHGLNRLREVIEHAAHLLPAQGPITVFIHHNTLHAFEHLPFEEAVRVGARVFGCQPYLSEDRYREELGKGRIRFRGLRAVLRDDLGESADDQIFRLGTRIDLRLAMLQFPLREAPTDELLWFVAETDALRRLRSDVSAAVRARLIAETRRWVMRDLRSLNGKAPAWVRPLFEGFGESSIEQWEQSTWEAFTLQALWQVCREGVRELPTPSPPSPDTVRHRDLLLQATGTDPDGPVHDLLTRYCAAFLDQGLSHWPLPDKEQGFYRSFLMLYSRPAGPPDRWLKGLAEEARRLLAAGITPLVSIHESLDQLGVPEEEWEPFLSTTLLALRGWGGMVRQVEVRGDRVAHPAPQGSLVEFLAVRLLLDRFTLAHTAREDLGFAGPLSSLRQELQKSIPAQPAHSADQRAFLVFQLAQVLGWSPDELSRLTPQEWTALVGEIEAFSALERRRLFHLAYELRFRIQSLDAFAARAALPGERPATPRYQLVTCLDEREESFRRHFEELAPDAETFGAAGFYGVAMYYRGAGDAHFVPLCPVIIRPEHWVEERVEQDLQETHRRRAQTRRALGRVSHGFHVATRSLALGAVLTAALGSLASIPLVARILFPRLSARIRRMFGRFLQAPRATRLELERSDPTPSPADGHLGYNLDEMAGIAERLLREIGLTDHFAPLVLILGHGSNSLNNPHKSAYDCGACGGSAGGPNARAAARMLNDPRVRERLASRGLRIPDYTVFVGGLHNTCDDSVTLADTDRIPESHRADFASLQQLIEASCERNAHERCRRFYSAPLTLSPAAARQHVEARSEDLAQTRPELGHATNALCVIARRSRTRGLYLDRRAFLTSYDPTQDDAEASILTRILRAAVPVCAGINLEYYFSRVDPTGWGCGTKLPHNIASLVGVMDGAASDLRTGLPWQMVEIHEPVRLLFLVESTPETLLRIMERNPGIDILVRNRWVHLACLDPESARIQLFERGAFRDYQPQSTQLPTAPSSLGWYRGWREHLEFALIQR